MDRVTRDACRTRSPTSRLPRVRALRDQFEALLLRLLRELFSVYEHRERRGIAILQRRPGRWVGVGRAASPSAFPRSSIPRLNDIAPAGYNDPSVPDGRRVSPWTRKPPTGFRWDE